MVNVILNVFAGTFKGVASGSGDYGPIPDRLLPLSTDNIRNVRLFCAMKKTDIYVFEKVGCFNHSSKPIIYGLTEVNNALFRLSSLKMK